MQRRDFVKLALATTGSAALSSCQTRPAEVGRNRRVFVLAFDGMHPGIVQSMLAAGRLPNLQRLVNLGSFRQLRTCMPPHTPVAFSNIISGADASVHQVFDFIHRDPNPPSDGWAVLPYFSTAGTEIPEHQWAIPLGKWELPLTGGTTHLLRRGPAFWDYLIAEGIDSDIYYLPANYPPPRPEGPGRFRCMSGMGTPDVLGLYGEFTFFTPDTKRRGKKVDGGQFVRLTMIGNQGQAEIMGPANHLQKTSSSGSRDRLTIKVQIVRDPTRPLAKIQLSGKTVLLKEGEWSHWIPLRFATGIPASTILGAAGAPTSVAGMVRLFLKQVHPKLELYVSPVNIDPLAPISPISQPGNLAKTLAHQHGRFYTTGIPEDTKALSHGVLNENQFLAQVEIAHDDKARQFLAAIDEFERGCLFFYFGATDLLQHMFWRDRDPRHPGRDALQAEKYGQVVEETYDHVDELVGEAMGCLRENDILMVFSDHGFNSFRRGFNLNSWLVDQGYVQLIRPSQQGQHSYFTNVDWSNTKAYGLGMNALYLNEIGREKHGIVRAEDKKRLLAEIGNRLLEVRDVDGSSVIDQVDIAVDLYTNADPMIAPDLILGYQEGYRASWDTVLGTMPREMVSDNMNRWSGTHLINPKYVPGVLMTNFPVHTNDPGISDIAPTILDAFGITTPSQMTGRSFLSVSTTQT